MSKIEERIKFLLGQNPENLMESAKKRKANHFSLIFHVISPIQSLNELRDDHTFLMYGSGGGWLGLKNHMFCTVRKMQKYLEAP